MKILILLIFLTCTADIQSILLNLNNIISTYITHNNMVALLHVSIINDKNMNTSLVVRFYSCYNDIRKKQGKPA